MIEKKDYLKLNKSVIAAWMNDRTTPIQWLGTNESECWFSTHGNPSFDDLEYRIDPSYIHTDNGWKKKKLNDVSPEEWDQMNQDRIDKEIETNGFAMITEEKQNPLDTQIGGQHYKEMNIQPWSVMRANNTVEEYTAYHINTVIAYLMRHKSKGGLQDIKKARHHLDELISYLEEGYV